ncbi:MAG: TadE family protein [Bryobacteraceae bacterium]
MRQKPRRGGAYIEFAFSLLVLVPLMLGVIGLGLNMLLQMQTVQLARDAGHMFARNINFTLAGNQQLLAAIAGPLGMTAGSGVSGLTGSTAGNSVVILSEVRYMDVSACALAGFTTIGSGGTPTGCTNYGNWVFSERLVIGNAGLRTSNLGTPPSSIVSSTDGTITITNQATNTSNIAKVPTGTNGFNPWNSTTGDGLPSGQWIYTSEAAATGFHMPPFSSGAMTYAQMYF